MYFMTIIDVMMESKLSTKRSTPLHNYKDQATEEGHFRIDWVDLFLFVSVNNCLDDN